MSSSITAVKGTGSYADIDLGPAGTSVQLMFAKLQLSQSAICKDEATKRMKEIQGSQQEQKDLAKLIAETRAALDKVGGDPKKAEKVSEELKKYCEDHKIAIPASAEGLNKDQWTSLQKTLTDKQELLGSGTQTVMVYLQDFIGQYNSFLQGANSAIATANQVLTGIAKGQ